MRKLEKSEKIAVPVAIVAAAILFFGTQIWNLTFGAGAVTQQAAQAQAQAAATGTSTSQTITMQNVSTVKGLEVYDEKVGTGAVAKTGQTVTAHYIGYLVNGTKFDSSVDRNQPFSFTLGGGQVIKGWDEGIVGMKVGGIRRLVISPELAYGTRAIGPIPANATLLFEVQLLNVK
jgi:FKBP-type peptidyl-prolyl cis-trans isomerase